MTTARLARRRARERAAVAAGIAVSRIGKGLPGTVGPSLVVVGLAGWSWQLGVLAAGAILWALDRRVP